MSPLFPSLVVACCLSSYYDCYYIPTLRNAQLNYIYQSDCYCQLFHSQSHRKFGPYSTFFIAPSPGCQPLTIPDPPAFIRVFSPSTHQASPVLPFIHRSASPSSEQGFLFFFLSSPFLCFDAHAKANLGNPLLNPDRVKLLFGLHYLPLFIFRFVKFPHSPLVESHPFYNLTSLEPIREKCASRYFKPKKTSQIYQTDRIPSIDGKQLRPAAIEQSWPQAIKWQVKWSTSRSIPVLLPARTDPNLRAIISRSHWQARPACPMQVLQVLEGMLSIYIYILCRVVLYSFFICYSCEKRFSLLTCE